MKSISGTNLDTATGSKQTGSWLAICRAVLLMTGLLAVVGSQAADILAGLADPTRPSYLAVDVGSGKLQPMGPVLQSTFISASQRRAVISGRTYTVGDQFGGGVITDIQPYEVVLKRADRETRLRLFPRLAKETSFVKVPVNSQEGGQK